MGKITREKFKTWGNVFDQHTERVIFRLISQGHFDGLQSPVSIGKEANIFTALKGDKKIIVKIYRLESCDFNRMYDYIRYDPRYIGLKKKRRKIIFSWCQREFRNLHKARDSRMRVPMPIAFMDNVLLIEMIGDSNPASKLKDALPKNPKKFCDMIIEDMARFHKAGLVHGDLSEFNILNHDDKPYMIDFSQASPLNSSNADELLTRDIKNIVRFFRKLGVKLDETDARKRVISGA